MSSHCKISGNIAKKTLPKLPHSQNPILKIRKIRIIYDDPDLTDDSSGEDDYNSRSNPNQKQTCKRAVREIYINPGPTPSSASKTSKTSKSPKTPVKSEAMEKCTPASKYRGVRRRKWGKYAAEIRDSIRGIRIWLGTFDTEEEAYYAYTQASMRLQAEKEALGYTAKPQKSKAGKGALGVSKRRTGKSTKLKSRKLAFEASVPSSESEGAVSMSSFEMSSSIKCKSLRDIETETMDDRRNATEMVEEKKDAPKISSDIGAVGDEKMLDYDKDMELEPSFADLFKYVPMPDSFLGELGSSVLDMSFGLENDFEYYANYGALNDCARVDFAALEDFDISDIPSLKFENLPKKFEA